MENTVIPKSFWQKKEGKPGMVVAIMLGIGVLYGLYYFLPFVISLLKNIYTTFALAGGLYLIYLVLSNKRFKTTCWYLFTSIMRALTGMVIELNPIAILESYIEDLYKKIQAMEEQIGLLRGQMRKLYDKIAKDKEDMTTELSLAQTAHKKNLPAEVALHSTQAKRLEVKITKFQTLYNKMEFLYKIVDKMKYYSGIMAKNTENEVQIRKEEYVDIKKAYNVMKSAYSVIKGTDDKRAIFNQTMDYMADVMSSRVGQMEQMMDASMDFISSVDLENAAYEDRGLQMLEEFENKGLDTIFGNIDFDAAAKSGISFGSFKSLAEKPTQISEVRKEVAASSNKYDNLLN